MAIVVVAAAQKNVPAYEPSFAVCRVEAFSVDFVCRRDVELEENATLCKAALDLQLRHARSLQLQIASFANCEISSAPAPGSDLRSAVDGELDIKQCQCRT